MLIALVARVTPQELPGTNSALRISVDPSKIHYFDPDTEAALN